MNEIRVGSGPNVNSSEKYVKKEKIPLKHKKTYEQLQTNPPHIKPIHRITMI